MAHGVPDAQLFGLQHGRGFWVQLGRRTGDSVRAVARHDDDLFRLQVARRAQRMLDQRHPAKTEQDLGQVRLYPAALSCCQNHGS